MTTIRIGRDVYQELHRHSTGFSDTPDAVLRRLLNMKPLNQSTQSSTLGKRTPQEAFRIPIIKALATLGGTAGPQQVLNYIEGQRLVPLTETDHAPTTTGRVRWQTACRWEAHKMGKDGLLTLTGQWTLTEQGRKASKDLRIA